ncbi:thiamine pyrophosphate-dependent enzyme [Paenibacillus sp. ACRRX]|uniref:1-deoxy-D-xylulose-5-phosphate synthase N-terminal domain-containing protein n=1 Tax=unclassified Paenibacillus TaxID=185978 RepID=UPI001EF5C288|nr:MULTISPECIES: 1-deoxy-D-xylulose-5-phosphate synthase N-terminal domain-containing protein [unclassified Paenibacillus]MCG7409273.1 thiamine pyrophosphate-dependent enzyme [Paenibacillus sp. ACRRX]MDK8179928.1 1-deoxy-D-xylulose-5-phosphate synthase N-terminal domain-containing protein [Paenibacillus sp. UMB4589-SE434]
MRDMIPTQQSERREQTNEISLLLERAREARELIIDMAAAATGCHIGGSLSAIDLLIGAYAKYGQDPDTAIILSKGHAAAALYAALHVNGIVQDNPAESYGQEGSLFTGHPNHKLPGIPFATGSLGHGIPYAAGWALAQKMKQTNGLGIVIGGDGELQEGLCWETAQIVQAQAVRNFIYIIDCNGGQNDGYVHDISPIRNLRQRFEAFGFVVREIDGHHFEQILAAIEPDSERPVAVLANTIKGKGVAAIEGNPEAHYVKISEKLAYRWKVSLA